MIMMGWYLLAIMSASCCGYFRRVWEDLKLVSCKLRMRSRCTNSVAAFTFAAGSVKYNILIYCILIFSILSFKTDIDDCAIHPCKNGSCTDRVNGFNCSCAPGFNGTKCETGNYNQNYFILYHVLWGFNIFLSCLQCCIVLFKYSFDIAVVSFVFSGVIEYARLLTF